MYLAKRYLSMIVNTRYMCNNKQFFLLLLFGYIFNTDLYAQQPDPDVLSYELIIEPDISNQQVKGTVVIRLAIADGENTITLNAGNLVVDRVKGESVRSFSTVASQLIVEVEPHQRTKHEITIDYHGKPKRGLLFNADRNQAHTVYFTDHWMICNNKPNDRATFSINLLLPKGMQSIASGSFLSMEDQAGKELHRWHQDYETPAYTYGFVIGSFTKATEQIDGKVLHYYSADLSENELKRVFAETSGILRFFEDKSGISYIQDSYSQVLIGKNYQEMSGLSVLADSYAAAVLKDSSEIHLTSHELAHQWWGNLITCENFGHFWLNEAFAVYMSSAYSEHKFGREKYLADIAIYKSIYDGLLKRGQDKALVFDRWESTRDNRHVVYYKGAYVLHLLREELGDDAFWKGILAYSKSYFGKSVKTDDFKVAMELATGTDLDAFFSQWVQY
ncbi:MAG: M1 family aminopeptidase [Cyclobacteriaceae bacterium]